MCSFQYADGNQCRQPAGERGLCIWHDPNFNKSGQNLSEELEALAKEGHDLRNLSLSRAHLDGVNLVNHGNKEGFDLSGGDFYRANLKNAHLFNANLSNSSLMKADLTEANLHFANLENTNLLGAKFEGAKIENINWGKQLLQERQGFECVQSQPDKARDFFEQSEEIYRGLRKVSEHQGLFELAGHFFYREMIMRRMQMPLFSMKRTVSKLVDLFCGYGEMPLRVIVFSIFMISICAIAYFFLGIQGPEGSIGIQQATDLITASKEFGKSFYFSVVTFTTLGYGDLTPIGTSRVVAALEAFFGSFTLALFVVVFVKKMTR